MERHDYRSYGIPKKQPLELDINQIPSAHDLTLCTIVLRTLRRKKLNLAGLETLDPAQLASPTTPEEQERFRILAALTQEVPELMEVIKQPPALLRDAHRLDMELLQLQAATRDLQGQTHLCATFVAQTLTEQNDRVEDAVTEMIEDPRLSAVEHRMLKYHFTYSDYTRAWGEGRRSSRKQRKQLRAARVQAQVEALRAQAEHKLKVAELSEKAPSVRKKAAKPAARRSSPRRAKPRN